MISVKLTHPRTVLLIDICTISLIKNRNKINLGTDNRKKTRLHELEEMAKSNKYRFSLLLAIIEKATDRKNELSVNQVMNEFKNDWLSIVDFVGENNIVEPLQSLEKLIPTLMDPNFDKREWAELSLEESIKLLNFYNSLGISSTLDEKNRISKTKEIVNYGKELGFINGHFTIIICVAAIHGCPDAQNILKIKSDGSNFNASNRLGDIMSFPRLAYTRALLKASNYAQKGHPDCIFRTEDQALENLHKYIKIICKIDKKTGDNVYKTHIENPSMLFPMLYNKSCSEKVREEIFNLLNCEINQ
ncbi:hypothetical protein ACK39D_17690 [Aeromonas veronii]